MIKNARLPGDFHGPIEFFESHGHTPGQLHTLIKGENSLVFFAGDLVPGTAWGHLPITMGYDRYPEKLIEEKQALYKRFSENPFHLFFTHDPGLCHGKTHHGQKSPL